ncbi:unnamed protein product [Alternaria alternata]
MAWLPPTSPATLRASKRTCEENTKDSMKTQCRSEFQTLIEAPNEFPNNYSQAFLGSTPQSSSSLFPVQPAYPDIPDTRLPDVNGIAVGHQVPPYDTYAPAPAYRDLNGQYSLTVPYQPPPSTQRSHDYVDYPHQYHPDEQAMSVLGSSVPQVPPDQGHYYPLDPSIATNPPVYEQPAMAKMFRLPYRLNKQRGKTFTPDKTHGFLERKQTSKVVLPRSFLVFPLSKAL